MTQTLPFEAQAYTDRINRALEEYSQPRDGCPERLNAAVRHSLLAPGKRLRPLLVLLAAEACGSNSESAVPAGCALEMIHAYSLIHDDLPAMDDDDLRRGRPSCHAAFDEATAILAGDSLLTQAFEVIANDVQPASVALRCSTVLAVAAGNQGMVGGQADDLDEASHQPTVEFLESIHRRKTGALLIAAVEMGGIVAEADEVQIQCLRDYGYNLGLAFQVVDDLLDWTGDEAVLGKRTNKDGDRGKLTYPGLLGVEASRERAAELVAAACVAVEPFGEAGQPLAAIARFVLERNK